MKINEILLEKKLKKDKKKLDEPKKKSKKDLDDLDKDDDAPAVDADDDTGIPHLVMQLRKALDVNGDYPITFQDGKQIKLARKDIEEFLEKYLSLKPYDREMMQKLAIQNLRSFHAAIQAVEEPAPRHRIKGTRYMTSFAGDFDDK